MFVLIKKNERKRLMRNQELGKNWSWYYRWVEISLSPIEIDRLISMQIKIAWHANNEGKGLIYYLYSSLLDSVSVLRDLSCIQVSLKPRLQLSASVTTATASLLGIAWSAGPATNLDLLQQLGLWPLSWWGTRACPCNSFSFLLQAILSQSYASPESLGSFYFIDLFFSLETHF